MTATAGRPVALRSGLVTRGIALVTAAGLAVDAVVHLQLAPDYQLAAPAGIGQGNLFRIAAVAAALVALWVLVRPGRLSFGAAFLVAVGALVAVLLYRYVDVPALGPIPSMYEPLWFPEKTLSAVAEAVATLAALTGLGRVRRSAVPR
jgi:hypothetical protein